MIKEAYCSFEVSKLLKEKGFNEYCLKNYWSSDKELHNWKWELGYNRNSDGNNNTKDCAAPTHQMAMAWLRETHHIAINIGWGEIFEDQYQWWCIILNMDNGDILGEINYHASYEETVEAAIKYCLENLI